MRNFAQFQRHLRKTHNCGNYGKTQMKLLKIMELWGIFYKTWCLLPEEKLENQKFSEYFKMKKIRTIQGVHPGKF